MLLFYVICSITGYLVYGEKIDIIITENILTYPDGTLSLIMVWLVILKCYISTPSYIFALTVGLEERFNISKKIIRRIKKN